MEEDFFKTEQRRRVVFRHKNASTMEDRFKHFFTIEQKKSIDRNDELWFDDALERLNRFNLSSDCSFESVGETPMEIDLSSGNASPEQPKSTSTSLHKTEKPKTVPQSVVYCTGIAVVLLAGLYLYGSVVVNHQAQLENIRNDLKAVVNQPSAVGAVVESLERVNLWHNPIKVLSFVGSSGVGKTFIANILKRNFAPLLLYEIKDKELDEYVFTGLNEWLNLIVIDDLCVNDSSRVIDFVARIPERRFALVLAIFTLDGKDNVSTIRKTLDESGLYNEIVLFNVLEVDVVQDWLYKELRKRNVKQEKQAEFVKRLVDPVAVERKGFKGIDAKFLLALDNIY